MIYIFLITIIFLCYDTFTLLPWYHIKGVFRVSDLGLLLVMCAFVWLFLRSRNRSIVFNSIGIVIFMYLLMTLVQVAIATINYDQSIISGLIQSRHQFYYLSYFVFLMALHESGRAKKFLNYCALLGAAVVILSLINYLGISVFHHRWAEGQGVRSGIVRAYIPGMNLIAMLFIWYMVRYVVNGRLTSRYGLGMLFFFFALLFRQTRGRIIAAALAAAWIMFVEKRFKMLAGAAAAMLLVGAGLGLMAERNLLLTTFESAYEDVSEGEGTWRGRMITIQNAWETFLEHPVMGSGARFIRQADSSKVTSEMLEDAYQGDLGYAHWLKNFGLVGVAWLLALAYYAGKQAIRNRRIHPDSEEMKFGEYQLVHIAISFVTINYLVNPEGIIFVCLALALLHCRAESDLKAGEAEPKQPERENNNRILRRRNGVNEGSAISVGGAG